MTAARAQGFGQDELITSFGVRAELWPRKFGALEVWTHGIPWLPGTLGYPTRCLPSNMTKGTRFTKEVHIILIQKNLSPIQIVCFM